MFFVTYGETGIYLESYEAVRPARVSSFMNSFYPGHCC